MKKEKVIANLNPLFLCGIAHRGYHNEQFTENGMKAFENAIKNNLAIELDVHLTTDNQLIVCHDEELKRTTGKEGIIEDLSVKEIKDNYKLLDGGEVPTFQEVLEFVNEKVPLVVELKVFRRNYKALANRLKEELLNIKDKRNIFLISFDPRSLFPFRNSGFMRSLLVTPSHYYTYMFRHLFESVDLDMKMFDKKKIQKYTKKHLVNVWTIQSKEDFEKVYPYVDTVTFQHFDCEYIKNRLKEKNNLSE